MDSLEQEAMQEEEMMGEEEAMEQGELSEADERDLHIAWMIVERLMEEGAIDLILDALDNSASPEQVIGQAIAQIFMQVEEQFEGEDKLSPNIFFAENGLLEIVGDYLEDEGVPEDVVGKSEMVAFATLKQVGDQQAAAQQQVPAPQQQQPPAAPGLEGMV